MARYGMVIDTTKCNGCYNCFIACKDEHCGTDHLPHAAAQPMTGHSWMAIREKERGRFPKIKVSYTPVPCMQCERPACVEAAAAGAAYIRDDGIVMIDPQKSAGRRELVESCPHGALYWNEQTQMAQKCTFCAHLLDAGWKEPRCVEACPTGALVFGDLDDPADAVSRMLESETVEALLPDSGLAEKVRYMGLPKRFVAGSVVLGDIDECAVGARVALMGTSSHRAGIEATTTTDGFGDFEFDDLPTDISYVLTISTPGYQSREMTVTTAVDVYVGDIILVR
jgi:Fe-S-cluster-containing dehydrogenase component